MLKKYFLLTTFYILFLLTSSHAASLGIYAFHFNPETGKLDAEILCDDDGCKNKPIHIDAITRNGNCQIYAIDIRDNLDKSFNEVKIDINTPYFIVDSHNSQILSGKNNQNISERYPGTDEDNAKGRFMPIKLYMKDFVTNYIYSVSLPKGQWEHVGADCGEGGVWRPRRKKCVYPNTWGYNPSERKEVQPETIF